MKIQLRSPKLDGPTAGGEVTAPGGMSQVVLWRLRTLALSVLWAVWWAVFGFFSWIYGAVVAAISLGMKVDVLYTGGVLLVGNAVKLPIRLVAALIRAVWPASGAASPDALAKQIPLELFGKAGPYGNVKAWLDSMVVESAPRPGIPGLWLPDISRVYQVLTPEARRDSAHKSLGQLHQAWRSSPFAAVSAKVLEQVKCEGCGSDLGSGLSVGNDFNKFDEIAAFYKTYTRKDSEWAQRCGSCSAWICKKCAEKENPCRCGAEVAAPKERLTEEEARMAKGYFVDASRLVFQFAAGAKPTVEERGDRAELRFTLKASVALDLDNGGSFLPNLLPLATGVDAVEYALPLRKMGGRWLLDDADPPAAVEGRADAARG